ncbi:BQ00720 family protein [Bosea sp. NPDC055332]
MTETRTSPLTTAEFAALGNGQVAYLKPIMSDELARIFPQAPEIEPGLQLFALLAADGVPILVTDSLEAATANAWEHDLRMVSLH